MTFSERLKSLRNKKEISQKDVAKALEIDRTTYTKYETGKSEPDFEMVKKIANFFNVTTDYLLGRSDKSTDLPSLTPRDERDIAKDLDKMLSDLEGNESLAFDGEPLNEEDKELLKISLENSMRLAKQLAKKKFTPKKYR